MAPPRTPPPPTRLALGGRVVTMDDAFTVLDRGVVYVDAGRIIAVRPRGTPAASTEEALRRLSSRASFGGSAVAGHPRGEAGGEEVMPAS